MLARMWRKGNSLTLLVGMQAGIATLENSLEVPQDVKKRATIQLSNRTTGIYPKETGVMKRRATSTPMFIAAMVTVTKLWKEPRCPSADEWIKIWSIYTMEYYSTIRKNEYPNLHQHGWDWRRLC